MHSVARSRFWGVLWRLVRYAAMSVHIVYCLCYRHGDFLIEILTSSFLWYDRWYANLEITVVRFTGAVTVVRMAVLMIQRWRQADSQGVLGHGDPNIRHSCAPAHWSRSWKGSRITPSWMGAQYYPQKTSLRPRCQYDHISMHTELEQLKPWKRNEQWALFVDIFELGVFRTPRLP